MSLREEIYKILYDDREICLPDNLMHNDIDLENITNEILSKIEKRIDKLIELHRKDKFGYFKVGEYDKAQSHLISQTFWKEVKELLK